VSKRFSLLDLGLVLKIQTERQNGGSSHLDARSAATGESGQVIVVAVLSMAILLGFLAFAVDVGILLRQKRVLQTAADSAAIAGAAELSNGIVAARAAALTDSSQNGVTNGSGGVAISVTNPPSSGPNASSAAKALYVEVLISKPQQTFFMNVFNIASLPVKVRAVAKAVAANSCIWALNTAAGKGVDIGGTTQLSLPNCGIIDNAAGATALNSTGSSRISAKFIDVAGSITGSSNISNTTSVTTGMTPQSDPLAGTIIPPSNPGGCTGMNVTSSQTIGPTSGGSICYSSLSIQSGATATLNPGTYYINGNLSVSGGASLSGSGVTFYITNGGSVSITGGAAMNLTAPTSGSLSGILFYQDSADSSKFKFAGGTAGTINGIFYIPGAQLDLNGGSGQVLNVDLVVGTLNVTGNSSLNSYAPLTGASMLSDPVLTE
jgi:Flp pilus assembly protein TadG